MWEARNTCDSHVTRVNFESATPDVQRTPSPTDISLTENPLAAPNSRAWAGSSGSVVSAITAGPAPESTAATPQRRRIGEIFRGRGHGGRPLRLMQPVRGRRHQQIGPLGQSHHQQRGAARVESRVDVATRSGSRTRVSAVDDRSSGWREQADVGCRRSDAAAYRVPAGRASVQDTTAPPSTAAERCRGGPRTPRRAAAARRERRGPSRFDKAIGGGDAGDDRRGRRAESARVRNRRCGTAPQPPPHARVRKAARHGAHDEVRRVERDLPAPRRPPRCRARIRSPRPRSRRSRPARARACRSPGRGSRRGRHHCIGRQTAGRIRVSRRRRSARPVRARRPTATGST